LAGLFKVVLSSFCAKSSCLIEPPRAIRDLRELHPIARPGRSRIRVAQALTLCRSANSSIALAMAAVAVVDGAA